MIREDVADALRLSAVVTIERLRRDRRRAPERFAPLFRCLETHLFDSHFGAEVAWLRSGVSRNVPFPFDVPLAVYLEDLRIDTAGRMFELGRGRLPSGRIAAAVGLAGYRTWQRAYRRSTGEDPPLIRRPEQLEPDFDDLGWHHARCGTLSEDGVRRLLKRLRGVGSRDVPSGATSKDMRPLSGRRGVISEDDAREALRFAAAPVRERLQAELDGLPGNVVSVVEDLAEHLFDPRFSVVDCRRRIGLSDTAISAKARFYLGDSVIDLVEKARVATAMHLAGDLRFTVERIAGSVGWSFRRLVRKCGRRGGATVGEVRKTLTQSAGDPIYQLWCRAGGGQLSRPERLKLEDFLRRLHPEVFRPPVGQLAVRADVDPQHVAEILELYRIVPGAEKAAREVLDRMLRTHPEYSAAHWYSHWVRDRLGRESLSGAWDEWLTANRDLAELLQQPQDQRVELVREVRRFQTDVFLWLLVDCVEVRLFHDGAESEHFADLAVAAAEAGWTKDRNPKSAGLRGLTLALKANAVRRRNELGQATNLFRKVLEVIRAGKVEPWIVGRVHCLCAWLYYEVGNEDEALRLLFVASSNYKRAGDELGRLRCANDRVYAWFVKGKDPSRLLDRCIASLALFPSAIELRTIAHLNRILAKIYIVDKLDGHHISSIKILRDAMPPPQSAYMEAEYSQIDGLIAALEQKPEVAGKLLKKAAVWFESHGVQVDATVCWLQFAWATLSIDSVNARQAALTACAYMDLTGLKGSGVTGLAFQIHQAVLRGELDEKILQHSILRLFASQSEARTVRSSEPLC